MWGIKSFNSHLISQREMIKLISLRGAAMKEFFRSFLSLMKSTRNSEDFRKETKAKRRSLDRTSSKWWRKIVKKSLKHTAKRILVAIVIHSKLSPKLPSEKLEQEISSFLRSLFHSRILNAHRLWKSSLRMIWASSGKLTSNRRSA